MFLAVLVSELLLRFAFTQPFLLSRLDASEAANYYRWVAMRRNKQAFTYGFDAYSPELGWLSKANLRDFPAFDRKTVSTNKDGLRGTNDFAADPDPRPRVLFLGDSFTFGDEVSDDETFCHYLQQMRPDLEIVNMGVHGYGHDQMLLLYRELGRRYKPDYVFLGYLTIDRCRNIVTFRDYAKPKFEVVENDLLLKNSPVASPEALLSQSWSRSRLVDFVSVLRWNYLIRSGRVNALEEETTTPILRELGKEIRASGARPVFFFLPGHWHPSSDQEISEETYLRELCESLPEPIDYFSARPLEETEAVRKAKAATKSHWDPLGNRIVAENIERHLHQVGLSEPGDSLNSSGSK